MHYSGTLDDGTVFDASEGREPLQFSLGEGQVIPGFEAAVNGLELGQKVVVSIEPEDAYGPRYEELSHTVQREDFGMDPFVGGMVNLISPEGEEIVGRITAIEGDEVTIDFNHPLAGERLTFEIELVEIGGGAAPIIGA